MKKNRMVFIFSLCLGALLCFGTACSKSKSSSAAASSASDSILTQSYKAVKENMTDMAKLAPKTKETSWWQQILDQNRLYAAAMSDDWNDTDELALTHPQKGDSGTQADISLKDFLGLQFDASGVQNGAINCKHGSRSRLKVWTEVYDHTLRGIGPTFWLYLYIEPAFWSHGPDTKRVEKAANGWKRLGTAGNSCK